MLVDVRGLDILDAGCGTGRWMEQLAERSPRSLLGVDTSLAMLKVAAVKLNNQCDLRVGSCTALPARDASADLVLCSFVVSYLDDLDSFVSEMDRVARPGATVVLSDMHPDTEASLNWVRWSPAKYSGTRIHGRGWPLQQITGAFEARGFKLVTLIEPVFGSEEREIFEQCGRPDLYQAAAALCPRFTCCNCGSLPVRRGERIVGRGDHRIAPSAWSPRCAGTGCSIIGFSFHRGWDDSFSPERGFDEWQGWPFLGKRD